MYTLPSGPTASPDAPRTDASVAGPPSPMFCTLLEPANVRMMPFGPTRRTRFKDGSEKYSEPSGPNANPMGPASFARVVGTPLPHSAPKLEAVGNPPPWPQDVPSPTTVVMIPSRPTRRMRRLD